MNTPNQDLPLLPAPLPTDAPPNTDNNSTAPPPQRANNDSTDKKRKREMVPNNNDPPRFAATGGITLPLPLGEIVEKTVLPHEPPPPPPPPVNNKMVQATTPSRDTIDVDGKGVWQCHKCKKDNKVSKSRCGNCQGKIYYWMCGNWGAFLFLLLLSIMFSSSQSACIPLYLSHSSLAWWKERTICNKETRWNATNGSQVNVDMPMWISK